MDMEQGKRLAGLILAVFLLQGKGPLGGLTARRRAQGKKPITRGTRVLGSPNLEMSP